MKAPTYTPRLIAIGPLHREDKHLKTPLQNVKMSYTDDLLSRVTAAGPPEDGEDPEAVDQKKVMVLRTCVKEMKKSRENAKKLYADEVMLDEEMLVVDGCFILEFLYRSSLIRKEEKNGPHAATRHHELELLPHIVHGLGPKADDPGSYPIFGSKLTEVKVRTDLLLLENQIPFFILEKLFQLTIASIPNNSQNKNMSLIDYVLETFSERQLSPPGREAHEAINIESHDGNNNANNSHILSIIHAADEHRSGVHNKKDKARSEVHKKNKARSEVHDKKTGIMPCASDLSYAGVKFVPGCTEKNKFCPLFYEHQDLKWWYHRARFVISPLSINDSTEILFRNFIAYEQCFPGVSKHVTCYAQLMDMLVNSDEDIQVLENAGILINQLGARGHAADLFNRLGKEVVTSEHDLNGTYNDVTEYSNRFWPKNMAYLKNKYFSSPWTFKAFCVGFLAFAISLVQFIRDLLKKE